MDFVAIDVETANHDMSSICQIGIAGYKDGQLVDEWKSYINPEDYFNGQNVSIHGIDESTVKDAPKLPDVYDTLYKYLHQRITVSHTHFDRVAINQSFEKYDLELPECIWLDSARVARRVWEEFAWKGYGLHPVCKYLKYDFKHHDALEDAKASGHIMLSAIKQTDICIFDWPDRAKERIQFQKFDKSNPASPFAKVSMEGNPEGSMYGQVIVFTGTLSIPRKEAAEMAAQIGFKVDDGVTKKTTVLVVGDQDLKHFAGHVKSAKHMKAEDLISKGHHIHILKESDFEELFRISPESQAQKGDAMSNANILPEATAIGLKQSIGTIEDKSIKPDSTIIDAKVIFESYGLGVRVTARDANSTTLWGFVASQKTIESFHCSVGLYDIFKKMIAEELKKHVIKWDEKPVGLFEAREAIKKLKDMLEKFEFEMSATERTEATLENAKAYKIAADDAYLTMKLSLEAYSKQTENTNITDMTMDLGFGKTTTNQDTASVNPA